MNLCTWKNTLHFSVIRYILKRTRFCTFSFVFIVVYIYLYFAYRSLHLLLYVLIRGGLGSFDRVFDRVPVFYIY
jgi:hypothetical protein